MEVGAALGPYLIERELGSGGMGKVYAATLEREAAGLAPGATVAIKVVHPHLLETEGFFKRFLREAQIGQSVLHDNVVRTLDCDAVGGAHFLVMEYVEGQTLAALQRELGRVPEELCRHVAREICKGLAAIHAAGVVHRDLKPENVLITSEHVVKVMDLGVARLTDEAIRLSVSGAFIGSVEYAAPEQFGGEVDHRSDLHSLGLLLYELSSGQHPYRADSFPEVMKKVREDTPRRLGEVNPQLSPFFEEVVHTLLAKDRDDRFESAGELLSILEEGEKSAWWHHRASTIRKATKRPLRRIRIPRETAVYGREAELSKLRVLYEKAKAGDGQVVLVEGEAGIGKSRLIDELIGRLQADGEDLNFLFGSYPPSGAAIAEGGFSTAFREQFGDAGSAPYLPDTPLLVPAFDAVLTGDLPPKDALDLTKDSIGTCFVHATRNLAAERPTIVLIDDLHFAPEEARGLFTALALAVPGHRVLLIGTMRPGVPEDWVANVTRFDHAGRMELQRLGAKDLAALMEDSFGSVQLADELGMKVVRKSDGNPFFVFEIIRGLREGQFITQKDDGTWASTRVIDEIQIPSSVLDLVNGRVATLTEQERDLLDVASCWGYEFDPALIAEVTGISRIPLYKQLAQVERAHRLVRSSGRNFVFDHHQVQEALYSSLPEVLREEYHAALAEALERRTGAAETDVDDLDGVLCVELCEHYLAGARGESALRYLESAQTCLSSNYLHAHAAALTGRALEAPDLLDGGERVNVLLWLAQANGPLDLLGRRSLQEEYAHEAERLAEAEGDEDLQGRATNVLGNLHLRMSRAELAEESFRRVLNSARTRGDKGAEADATSNLGFAYWAQGRLDEAQGQLERYLDLSREIGDGAGEADALGKLGLVLFNQRRLDEAREHHQRHLDHSLMTGERQGEAVATGNLGTVFWSQGRLADAQRFFERALALSRETGRRQTEATATGNLGAVLLSEGRLDEARELQERRLALCLEIGDRHGEAIALHNLGRVLREQGDHAQSEARLATAVGLCEDIGYRRLLAHSQCELGSLRCARRVEQDGDLNEGRKLLLAASNAAQSGNLPGVETLARCNLASLSGESLEAALSTLAKHERRLSSEERREACLLLWRATGDRAHLLKGKQLLDEALTHVPAEYHDSMSQNLRVNREILAAWREEFGDEGDTPGEAPPGASPTR